MPNSDGPIPSQAFAQSLDPATLQQLMALIGSKAPPIAEPTGFQQGPQDYVLPAPDPRTNLLDPSVPINPPIGEPKSAAPDPFVKDQWFQEQVRNQALRAITPATNEITATVPQTTQTTGPALTTSSVLKNTGMAPLRVAGGAVKGALTGLLNARSFGDVFSGPFKGAAKGVSDAGRKTLGGYGLNIPGPATNAPANPNIATNQLQLTSPYGNMLPGEVSNQKAPGFFRRLNPFKN